MIISILNQKGGVGKTTLAVHVATSLAMKTYRVLLVDADPQGSALDWSASRTADPLFPVVGIPKPSIHREIPALSADYGYTIIDGPPRVYDVGRSAILASDLVLIPVQPSPYDVWAAKEIIDLIGEASLYHENLKSAFVINRKIVNTAIGRDVVSALSDYSVPVLKAQICQRVGFADSAAQGLTVLETDPTGTASREIETLVREVMALDPNLSTGPSANAAAFSAASSAPVKPPVASSDQVDAENPRADRRQKPETARRERRVKSSPG